MGYGWAVELPCGCTQGVSESGKEFFDAWCYEHIQAASKDEEHSEGCLRGASCDANPCAKMDSTGSASPCPHEPLPCPNYCLPDLPVVKQEIANK